MIFDYTKHLIYLHVAGSRSYGTDSEGSDWDYRGIIVPPRIYFLGCNSAFEKKQGLDGYGDDSTGYDIRKFMRLCADNNPNIIEALFIREEDQVIKTKFSKLLIDNRHLFLSKKCRFTFGGYAHGQMQRLKSHRVFVEKEMAGNVPERPRREDFGLAAQPSSPGIKQLADSRSLDLSLVSEAHREELSKEQAYRNAKAQFDQWDKWRKTRNKKRYELEAKYGYDCKHAYHLVRLLRMAEEILTEGQVIVYRPDREELKQIRNGVWSYEKLIDWTEEKFSKLDDLYKSSTLQKVPKAHMIDELCMEIVEEYNNTGGAD